MLRRELEVWLVGVGGNSAYLGVGLGSVRRCGLLVGVYCEGGRGRTLCRSR